jgi:hypothetical protein
MVLVITELSARLEMEIVVVVVVLEKEDRRLEPGRPWPETRQAAVKWWGRRKAPLPFNAPTCTES